MVLIRFINDELCMLPYFGHLSQNVSVPSFEPAQNFMADRTDLPDSCEYSYLVYSSSYGQETDMRPMQTETFAMEALSSDYNW